MKKDKGRNRQILVKLIVLTVCLFVVAWTVIKLVQRIGGDDLRINKCHYQEVWCIKAPCPPIKVCD